MFSKKATKIDKIFTVDLTLCSNCQIDGEDFINFCGLLRKHELYLPEVNIQVQNGHEVLGGPVPCKNDVKNVVSLNN